MDAPRRDRLLAGLAYALTLAVIAALAFTRLADPDLGFHLATGRAVLAAGAIPKVNVLSFTEPDHPWVLHHAIPAVLFELIHRKFGTTGLMALKLALIVPTWGLVIAAGRRLGASPIVASLAALLGAAAAAGRFSLRPLLFSNLGLAAALLLIASARGADERRRRGLVIGAGVIAVIGMHLHAGAIVTLTLLAAVGAGIAIEPLRARLFRDELRGPAGIATGGRVIAVAIGATVIAAATLAIYHPYPLGVLGIPFRLGGDPYLVEHVIEYRSPFTFRAETLLLFWVFFAIVVLATIARARRTHAAQLVAVIGFGVIALRHVRAIDVFAIVAAPALAASLQGIFDDVGRRVARAGLGVALAVPAIAMPIAYLAAAPIGMGFDRGVWPMELLDVIEREKLDGHAYVSDGWAGAYLARFYPRERAFFDARFEAYSPELVRDVYRKIRYGEPGWEALLDRYDVDVVLLKYTSPGEAKFQGGGPNVRQHLAHSPRWALVAFGDAGELFVRRDGRHAEQAARLAIPGVDPDRGELFAKGGEVPAGLVGALARGLDDGRVFALTAVALAGAGDKAGAKAVLARGEARRPGDPQIAEVRDRLVGP